MGAEERRAALELAGFRIRMYRSIRDSGFVPVFPLTALVGRKRSGKTSLLRALRGLDPALRRPFALDEDWPRGSRQPRANEHVVCSGYFRLAPGARDELAAAGSLPRDEAGLRVDRTYGGLLRAAPWAGDGYEEDHLDGPGPPDGGPDGDHDPHGHLTVFARERFPAFLWAESSELIPEAIPADALAEPRAGDEETGAAALARLLAEAGLGAGELEGDLDPRRVRAAGLAVRELLAERAWPMRLALDASRGRVLVALESGRVRTAVDRVARDRRAALTFALRLAAAPPPTERQTVFLLDGPGRSFRHAGPDRMRTLFDSCVARGAEVLYTARLPFQIELQHSEQVLVLAPERPESLVTRHERNGNGPLALRAALGMTGRSSFPVDDLNLIVEGPSDDAILRTLDALLRRSGEPGLPEDLSLTSANGSHEVASVSAFLGRQGLGVIALLDADSAGRASAAQLASAARADERLARVDVLLLADAAGLDTGDAAIEGLFPTELYAELATGVCGPAQAEHIAHVLRVGAPAAHRRGDRNPAARLARAFEAAGRRFPKGRVAEALERRVAELPDVSALEPETARTVRRLMASLRAAADHVRAATSAGPDQEPELADDQGDRGQAQREPPA